MFETILVKPIFNLLVGIYAILPWHNLGLAIIVFTIVARFAMWPVVKKQLHHAKAMRELQPELKKIKKEAKGDRQKEAMATMALYKEREVSPFAGIGYLILQLPIFIALYQGVNRIANNQDAVIDNAYGFVRDLPHMEELAADISLFDPTALGSVDLTTRALSDGTIMWGAMIIVVISAAIQYYSSKQLIATQGEKKSLRKLLKDQSAGKDVDQADISAAVGRSTIYIIPGLIFFISLGLVAALPFYWAINGAIAFAQQKRVLDQDATELAAVVDGEEVVAEVEQPKKMNAKQKREAMKAGATTKKPVKKKPAKPSKKSAGRRKKA